jgi:lipopolysaccharide/colanic/teichoic acid biosynthesis glycosyltransferase
LDLLGALVGLCLLAPVFGIIAILIKIGSPGPVFFRQERVGQNGKTFRIFKFRSMETVSDPSGSLVTSSGDSRITPIGAYLRRHKLDEYPQLINVLMGQMSLVGPRPEVPRYVECYPSKFKLVFSQKPGITHRVSQMLRHEEEILARAADPEAMYINTVLPWKLGLYIENSSDGSLISDLKTIWETVFYDKSTRQKIEPPFDMPEIVNIEAPDQYASQASRSATGSASMARSS